jgi:ribonuclease HI
MVKLNVDGSFILQDGTASVGIILRRHDGSIILSSCRVLVRCCSALEAELRALVEGVSLASEWCQKPILIETDSDEILRMIRSKERDLSELGNLTSEAKFLLNSDQIVGISKIPRSQNFASHELAKYGRLNDRTYVWFGSGPDCILDALLRDCNDTYIYN